MVYDLPNGYEEILSIDMKKNIKLMILVNGLAIVIAFIMVAVMYFCVPLDTLFDGKNGRIVGIDRPIVLIVSAVAYIVLHELVHGITMKLFGAKKVKYGFKGLYAFACSDGYYDKRSFIIIALAPIVVWGAVLVVINALVPIGWFWIVYILQIINISGAAGDMYVTVKFAKLPKDILIKDVGVGMTVYSKQTLDR